MTFLMKYLWFYSLDWLKLVHQGLHRQLFTLKNVFLPKFNCCKTNLSFSHRLDETNRSAIAPLVTYRLIEIVFQFNHSSG